MKLDKIFKLFYGNIGTFENGPQRAGLNAFRAMNGYDRTAAEVCSMPHYNVGTTLSQNNKPGFLQGSDYTVAGNLRNSK